MDTSIVYLARDGADLVCRCTCSFAAVAYPVQANCPWCGCGWLFTCIDCRQPFAFARGVVVDDSWEELARHDLIKLGGREPSPHLVRKHAEAMRALLAGVRVGRRYVYVNGVVAPADAVAVHFTGRHAGHDLDFVPQVEALKDRSSSPRCWTTRPTGARRQARAWKNEPRPLCNRTTTDPAPAPPGSFLLGPPTTTEPGQGTSGRGGGSRRCRPVIVESAT